MYVYVLWYVERLSGVGLGIHCILPSHIHFCSIHEWGPISGSELLRIRGDCVAMPQCDGRPWCRRGKRSMEDTKKKMKCSGNEDKSKKSSRQWRFLVKMKSRSGAMVWKVARGDEGEG